VDPERRLWIALALDRPSTTFVIEHLPRMQARCACEPSIIRILFMHDDATFEARSMCDRFERPDRTVRVPSNRASP
jgi:hypothetical protein